MAGSLLGVPCLWGVDRCDQPQRCACCIFALGIGLAFSAPVWGAIVPDIVSKEELPSAVTLGGVQLNLSGIVGPALGGFCCRCLARRCSFRSMHWRFLSSLLSFCSGSRAKYRRPSSAKTSRNRSLVPCATLVTRQRMKTILFRNVLFSVVISVIPALLPVIAIRECACSAAQLGLVFACVGVGSLAGAVFALPYLRQRISPNAITSISMAIMVIVLFAMALIRRVPALMILQHLRAWLGRWRDPSFGWLDSA